MTYKKYSGCADTRLMKLYLNHPDMLRRVMITDSQVSVLRLLGSSDLNYTSTKELYKDLDISIQSASARLSKLWKVGYLIRREVVAPTGGIEYFYKLAFELPEN